MAKKINKKKIEKVERKRVVPINNTGLLILSNSRLPDVHFYEENGAVLLWATVADEKDYTGLEYLTPIEAMKFARAMEKCAIQAFRHTK